MALMIIIAIGVVPVGNFVLNPLERAYAPNPPITQAAGILVLGGAEDMAPAYAGSVAQVNEAGDRLIAAMQLARQFPDAALLYTGGKAALTPVAADTFEVGHDILRQLGLPGEQADYRGTLMDDSRERRPVARCSTKGAGALEFGDQRVPYAAGNGEFLRSRVVEPGAISH
jgi:hypothetical protein